MKLTNKIARFGWWFSAFFLLMCGAFTYILIRDGASNIQIYPPSIPDYYPPWLLPAVLALFWAVGIGVATHMAAIPCVEVEVGASGTVRIDRRYPFKKESQTFRPQEIASVEVVEGKDVDGHPYFTVRLTTVSGLSVAIAEGSDKGRCEEVQAQFKAALARDGEW